LILRVYSAIFELILSGFLFVLGFLSLIMGTSDLKMKMLPWFSGPNLRTWIILLGFVGIICSLLALMGKARFLLVLWSIFVFVTMIYGFFVGPYVFRGASEAQSAAWLCFGALGAVFGAWWGWTKPPARY
jgi:hypothetical protein